MPDSKVRMRPDITTLQGYTYESGPYDILSERLGMPPERIIKLDTNENLYGPSPKALEAMAHLHDQAHIYPDAELRRLRGRVADYVGVDARHILVGSGEDELIYLTTKLFLGPGDAMIDCPPTFPMYELSAQWVGGKVVNVPRNSDFSLDVEKIEATAHATGAKLLWLCNPNNPDGSMTPLHVIERLLELDLVVVVDEAYIEFCTAESLAKRVPDVPNLIVLRTMSKWAGLAGMRVGYGIFPEAIIENLWKIKLPFNISVAADVAAQATFDDLPEMQARVQKLVAERERMESQLAMIPFLQPYPGQGSFVLCRVREGVREGVRGMTPLALKKLLEADGILIRCYSDPMLQDMVRISVGKPEHTDALMEALVRIAKAQKR